MQLKTYRAPNVKEAIARVKADLGPNAIVLSTRTVKSLTGLMGRHEVEVTAAFDQLGATTVPANGVNGANGAAGTNGTNGKSAAAKPAVETGAWDGALTELRSRIDRLERDGADEGMRTRVEAMSRKLDDLMRSIEQIAVGESAASEVAWGSRALADLYRRLTEGGVADEAAALVIREAAARLDEEGRADEFRALDAVAGEIMRRVRIADPFADVGRRQVVCALVGPTGVGKTTTIAKLAGAQVLEHGRKAAFLTTDTFRVGAVDQLRAYARILGVPLDVAVDDNDLSEKIARHADKDVIFIDTQGVGQKDAAMMRRLAGYFERMRQVDLHLIVSATTQASDLEDIAESYREFPVASVIASKLDESNELGGIYTLLAGRNQSASFFTVGQKVPEDIETATRERVVDRLLGITAH